VPTGYRRAAEFLQQLLTTRTRDELRQRLAPKQGALPPKIPGGSVSTRQAVDDRWRVLKAPAEVRSALADPQTVAQLDSYQHSVEHLLCYSWPTYQTIMRVATPGEKIVDTLRLDRPDKTIPPRGWRGRRPPIGRRVSNAGPIEGCW